MRIQRTIYRYGAKWRSVLLSALMTAATAQVALIAFQGKPVVQGKPAKGVPPKLGDSKTNSTDGLTYLWIPPGSYTGGCSPNDKDCFPDETPNRKTTLTRGFWLSRTEVTQAAFEHVMGYNPSVFQGSDLPVENVSWVEADAYCTEIGGRLPSEAEWEYSARAGTTGSRYGNLDEIAWYYGNAGLSTHPVGKKKPNAFGLYDMLGNVVEWTHTYYWVQHNQENINPTGPSTAEYVELRGGGWWDDPKLVRVSYRRHFEKTDIDYNIGFRCISQ